MKLEELKLNDEFELNDDRFMLKRKIDDRIGIRYIVECTTGYNREKGEYYLGKDAEVRYVDKKRRGRKNEV